MTINDGCALDEYRQRLSQLSCLAKDDPEKFAVTRNHIINEFLAKKLDSGSLLVLQNKLDAICQQQGSEQSLKEIARLVAEKVEVFHKVIADIEIHILALDGCR